MEIKKAVRRALPMQFAFSAPTGSGKTLSALLLAAGLSPDGRVVVIDTERGRASMYADNKRLLSVLPQGFDVIELEQPYSPENFIKAIDLAESNGYAIAIIDSGSDSWDGPGGCTDIAERDKGWAKAKSQNKRMMTRAALSNMTIIWCLKAHEKVKIIDKHKSASGKQEFIDMGIQPIWEKNNFYPMVMAFSVDPVTHKSTATKCIDELQSYFAEPRLITREDGIAIRRWNESGAATGEMDQILKRAAIAAEQGMAAYQTFFKALAKPQQANLSASPAHAENKQIAAQADADAMDARAEELSAHPRFRAVLGAIGYESWPDVPADKRTGVITEVERELAA